MESLVVSECLLALLLVFHAMNGPVSETYFSTSKYMVLFVEREVRCHVTD